MERNYKCEKCGRTEVITNGVIPKCCGKPMKILPLDICIQPSHAEHTRPMEDEEPCDEGRAG